LSAFANKHLWYLCQGLGINKIKKLTLDEFEEEPVVLVEPNFKKI
jgi:hypothetical protein